MVLTPETRKLYEEEIERREKAMRKRQQKKEIEEAFSHKEIVITSENAIGLENKISKLRKTLEELETEKLKVVSEIEDLDIQIINKTEQLKNLKQELAMDKNFQLALLKIEKGIEKRKKSQSQT
jgi:hypothetical protein